MRNGSKKGSAIDMHPSQMHISKPSLQGDGVRRWELGEVIRSQLRALIKGISALGAWQATVHRVAKSQTKLKQLSTEVFIKRELGTPLVVQWLSFQCRGHGFDPWSRKIPHAVRQLSLWATATKACTLQSPHAATPEPTTTTTKARAP